jgi:hypothetical protein
MIVPILKMQSKHNIKTVLNISNPLSYKSIKLLMTCIPTWCKKLCLCDPKSPTLSRTSDTTETRNPYVIKVIVLACFTYIDIFKFIKSLLTYWQEF